MSSFKRLNLWAAAIVSVFFLAGIVNASAGYGKYKMIEDSLTDQIRKDFSERNLTVGIKRVSNLKISSGKQALFGDGYYELNNERTPIFFEIIFNLVSNKIASIDYTFVENNADTSDVFLQKLIIKKLGNDYKTKEIMMSVDGINKIDQTGDVEKYRGTGEVRIGSLVMKKIKFEINLDADSEKILYKLDEM